MTPVPSTKGDVKKGSVPWQAMERSLRIAWLEKEAALYGGKSILHRIVNVTGWRLGDPTSGSVSHTVMVRVGGAPMPIQATVYFKPTVGAEEVGRSLSAWLFEKALVLYRGQA